MEDVIITIDTGTTNTRVILWDKDRKLVGIEKREIGVRDTAIDGNNLRLKQGVRDSLAGLLQKNGCTYGDVKRIIASGMITSDVGLVEIPHLVAPAGLKDLAKATKPVLLEDVCPLPIWFIPGIKNFGTEVNLENFEAMDIMRGEEVESIPIIRHCFHNRPMLLVLPGSHTKFVSVNGEGRISGCLTTVSGELWDAITMHTIISGAVGHKFVRENTYDGEFVLRGFRTAEKVGMSRSLFSGRILSLFTLKDKSKVANFILGAVLQNDIAAIRGTSVFSFGEDTDIIVAGNNPLREAFVDILKETLHGASVREFLPDADTPLSALGAYLVAEQCGIL